MKRSNVNNGAIIISDNVALENYKKNRDQIRSLNLIKQNISDLNKRVEKIEEILCKLLREK